MPYLAELNEIDSHVKSLAVHEAILKGLDSYDVMHEKEGKFLTASREYSGMVKDLVGDAGAEKGALEAQETQYKEFGTTMDDYAESREDLSQVAPRQAGGERYETLLAVVGKLRSAWTLSRALSSMNLGGESSSSVEFSTMVEALESRRSEREPRLEVERLTVPPAEHQAYGAMKSSLELGETFARELAPFESMLDKANNLVHRPEEGYVRSKENGDAS